MRRHVSTNSGTQSNRTRVTEYMELQYEFEVEPHQSQTRTVRVDFKKKDKKIAHEIFEMNLPFDVIYDLSREIFVLVAS